MPRPGPCCKARAPSSCGTSTLAWPPATSPGPRSIPCRTAGHAARSGETPGHLLDRVLPAAYTQQPGEPPPRYDLATAERALRRIATRMNKDGTRDLQWWRVPAWTHAAPRVIAAGLTAGLAFGLAAGLAY